MLLRVLKPKGQGHSKNQKQMLQGTINIPPKNKISRNKHLSMKLSDTFDQNPPCTFDKIRETHSDEKALTA